MIRIFLALPLQNITPELRILHKKFAEYSKYLKIVKPENYHITLKFLGDSTHEAINEMRGQLEQISLEHSSLKYKLKGIGSFGNKNNPSVIWCGIDTDLEKIKNLQNAVDRASISSGFQPENREFSPHLTLARGRSNKQMPSEIIAYLKQNRDKLLGEGVFSSIIMFRSILSRDGATYEKLHQFQLAPGE